MSACEEGAFRHQGIQIAMDALVGCRGFIGSILARQREFGAQFDSSTFRNAAPDTYGTIVCAAAPGSMFEANRFPDRDMGRIESLIAQLTRVRAERFVLISSIAVLADFGAGADEETVDFQTATAYGRNRRTLEVFCSSHFDNCLILRLPALFGPGLRKNFLFDILNPMPSYVDRPRMTAMSQQLPPPLGAGLARLYTWNDELGLFVIDRTALDASGRRADYDSAVLDQGLSALQFTNRQSRFQFYELGRLADDIDLLSRHSVEVAHLATEPLDAALVFEAVTGSPMPETTAKLHLEDMRTRYAALWRSKPPYISSAGATLGRLRLFFDRQRDNP